MSVTTRRYHARHLERKTRIRALEGQARLLLNDLNEYGTWLEWSESRPIGGEEVVERWLGEVYRPTLARIGAAVGPNRDRVQAYCDVLEEKWFLSEQAGRDIGLATAIDSYLALGAPAPEVPAKDDDATAPLDRLDLEHELDLLDIDPDELDPIGPEGAAGADGADVAAADPGEEPADRAMDDEDGTTLAWMAPSHR